ncbi:arylsulfatase [Qipengyuania sp. GH25]|uniref:Arylsulfatase n=1 Tax=Qipengyuania pacifica TaxID=2860199 RepID=A0ABS7JD09_9SPHN|nr:arylsulfatase [Qipengyuania aerophila]MBX7487918.1 arylsulfatase [Qipengyuania aerophila]
MNPKSLLKMASVLLTASAMCPIAAGAKAPEAPASAAVSAPAPASAPRARQQAPNVLVILADDMGWSDIAPYGGEVSTPNLTMLARDGVRMTNFHVSPFCSPSRAMLLTGADNHQVGLGNMVELLTEQQRGQPGYEGQLNARAVTIAQRLQGAGYYTLMAGKWHLGLDEDESPASWGFDRSFSMLRGEANHYQYEGKDPSPDGPDLYRFGKDLVSVPAGFYSSDTFASYLNMFINEDHGDKPFFAFLSFTAPHSPLQAPPSVIAKYRGRYDDGPRALAKRRLANLKSEGLVEETVEPHEMIGVPEWSSLTPTERAAESRRMEIYAAMIDRMDYNIGRVIANLKDKGLYDNTIIMFLSDNGAAGGRRETNRKWGPWIAANFDNSLDNMGSGTSYVSTGPGWAQASMAPSAYFKGFTSEGGTHSPMIISGPGVSEDGISGAYGDVRDLVPTILDFAGVVDTANPGKAAPIGHSLAVALETPSPKLAGPSTPSVLEMRGGRAVRMGDWKALLVTSLPTGLPADELPLGHWLLYNVVKDPGETTDLAAQHPEILALLTQAYDAYAQQVGIVSIPNMIEANAKR